MNELEQNGLVLDEPNFEGYNQLGARAENKCNEKTNNDFENNRVIDPHVKFNNFEVLRLSDKQLQNQMVKITLNLFIRHLKMKIKVLMCNIPKWFTNKKEHKILV